MTKSNRIEGIIKQFSNDYSEYTRQVTDLREAIETSPELTKHLDEQIKKGTIRNINLLSEWEDAEGSYDADQKTVSLSPRLFLDESKQDRIDSLTYVLGHEVGHATIHEWTKSRRDFYHSAVLEKARASYEPQD